MSPSICLFIFAITVLVLIGICSQNNIKEGLVNSTLKHSPVNVSLDLSWLSHNGECRQVNASSDDTKQMLDKLVMHGDIFESRDSCEKHLQHTNKHHSSDSQPDITVICDNEVETIHNPHVNPNVHYSNSHLNTGQTPWRALAQLHG